MDNFGQFPQSLLSGHGHREDRRRDRPCNVADRCSATLVRMHRDHIFLVCFPARFIRYMVARNGIGLDGAELAHVETWHYSYHIGSLLLYNITHGRCGAREGTFALERAALSALVWEKIREFSKKVAE